MKKSVKQHGGQFPQPVMIIASYDEAGVPDAMNAAWVTMRGMDVVEMVLSSHQTTDNIRARRAFTVAPANAANLVAADYVGIESARKVANKAEKSGLTFVKSDNVDAPVIEEFPVTMECEVVAIEDYEGEALIIGRVVNTLVEEDVLDAEGKVDFGRVGAVVYDPAHCSYRPVGDELGSAWGIGRELM